MDNIREKFENEGLKIDKERILTYSKLSCPLECSYCFVDEMNTEQSKHVAYLTENQLQLLEQLPKEITLIMLGCDTEFFQNKEESLKILKRLSSVGRDLSVITKLHLKKDFIDQLRDIDIGMRRNGNILGFSVSLPITHSFKRWEPVAPDPIKRIETLKYAHDSGLVTMVAMRPLLPTVTDEELEHIVEQTKDIADAYYSGPLYLKNPEGGLLSKSELAGLQVEELQPHWMLDGNKYFKIVKPGQMEKLEQLLLSNNKPFLEGAAEGIQYFKNNEKH